MALPVTDSFTTGSDAALTTYSANWSMNTGLMQVLAASDDWYSNSSAAETGAFHNVETYNNDQYAQVVTKAISDASFAGAACRCGAAGVASYYGFYQANTSDYSFKMVTGTFTQFGSTGSGGDISDVLRIEASGTSITSKRNGGTVRTQTDSSLTSGKAGMCGYGGSSDTRADDFEGGNLSTGVTVSPAAASAASSRTNPTVELGSTTASPSAASAVGSKIEPTVIAGNDVVVAPAAASGRGNVNGGLAITGTVVIAPVGTATTAVSTGGASITLTLPTGWAAGDLGVAVIAVEDNTDRINLGTPAAGWTELINNPNSTNAHRQYVFYRVLQGGDGNPTWTLNASDEFAACMAVFRGIAGTPIGNSGSQDNTSSTANQAPAITVNLIGEAVLHAGSAMYGTTSTPPTGSPTYTELADVRSSTGANNMMVALSYAIYTATGSTGTKDATLLNGDINTGSHVALQPNASVLVQPAGAGAGGRTVDPTVVIAGGGETVSPAAASAAGSRTNPTVELSSTTASPAAASAAGGVAAPTVVLGSMTIAPTGASAAGGVAAPTVVLGSLSLTPSAASGAGTVVQPGVELGSTVAAPSAASAKGSVVDPVVGGGGVEVAPAAASAAGSVTAPTIVLGSLVIGPSATMAAGAAAAPAVILGSTTATPNAASGRGLAVDPSVLTGGNISITPSPASAAGGVAQPGIGLGSTSAAPSAASAAGGKADPTVVYGSLAISPSAAAAGTTIANPGVILGSVTITPTAAASVVTVAGPETVLGSMTVAANAATAATAALLGLVLITNPDVAGRATASLSSLHGAAGVVSRLDGAAGTVSGLVNADAEVSDNG